MFTATKRIDRLLTRGKEMIGQEAKTQTNDDFRALESEMNLRHDGMDRLHKSMNGYVKHVSKRTETEDRDKMLPVAFLGAVMATHGGDFDQDSEFGSCLVGMGRANEAISRKTETYGVAASTTWLESLERSLAQMKEYQAARKKLEQRRVAYDTSLTKMQRQKREDFRMEEELRAQKAKYEEASEDVHRRMEDIRAAETESVQDLTAFLDAQFTYYDSCAQILAQLKREWPAQTASRNIPTRTRSNTAHSFNDRFRDIAEESSPPEPTPRMTIARVNSSASTTTTSRPYDRDRDLYDSPTHTSSRPPLSRAATQDSPRSTRSDLDSSRDWDRGGGHTPTYSTLGRMDTVPRLTRSVTSTTEPSAILARTALRPVSRQHDDDRYFGHNSHHNGDTASAGMSGISRTTSWGSDTHSVASYSTGGTSGVVGLGKKAPPPPPPSRATKPKPPPPPPGKRSGLGNEGY